jgi:ABC-type ATPase involved in cell division
MPHTLKSTSPRTTASTDTPVLEYDRVVLGQTWPYDTMLDGVSFSIQPGDLLLLTLAPGHVRSPFADMTQALRPPDGGAVRFLGRNWQEMPAGDVVRHRFQIARVFDVGGWISNLGVDENVLLAQRHYNTAPLDELRRRAEDLAQCFGLEALPRKRPASASQYELRLSQWVRALLGRPQLLVLERPTKDVRPEAVPPFLKAVEAARERGTAVLWITTDGAGPNTPHNIAPADPTIHLGVRGSQLQQI